jgi:hypothetical protein
MTVWWLRAGISILAVALLAACAANESNTYAAQLEFRATSEIGADQQLYVTLEIHNAGEGTFPGDENLAATMELVDSAGLLRGHVDVARLDVLPAGESVWPATWKGHLEAGRLWRLRPPPPPQERRPHQHPRRHRPRKWIPRPRR